MGTSGQAAGARTTLPETASNLPALLLLGCGVLASAGGLHVLRLRRE